MRTIETTATVTEEGILTINVPRDVLPGTHAVVVVIDEAPVEREPLDERGWPVSFFEHTFGSFADDPLERGEQGAYEVRKELA